MSKPYFSVVIPTHNRSELLKRAIVSVMNQTFKDFEALIIDDNSNDNTFSVVDSFSDDRIHYLVNDRSRGAGGARNVGIFRAKGKWVAFLDDDDVWLPDKLKCQYEIIRNVERTIGLVCTDYMIYKGKKRRKVRIKNRPSGWVMNELLNSYGKGCMRCLSSMCIRTDLLKSVQGFDERFPSNQDLDLWLRITQKAAVTHIPEILVVMFQENRDRIGTNPKAKLDGHLLLRKKYAVLIDKRIHTKYLFESYTFPYALLLKEKYHIFRNLPWVLFGAVIDLPNFFKTISTFLILFYRQKIKKKISMDSQFCKKL